MPKKQIFINACNTLNGDDFIMACSLFLKNIYSKDELNDFVAVVGGIFKAKQIVSSDVLDEFCLLFRNKAYDVLLNDGHIPECNIINIYYYFGLCKLMPDDRFLAYEAFLDKNVYADGVSDMDRIYLIILRFFVSYANSKEYAFEIFLSSLTLLDFMQADEIGLSLLVIDFINHCGERADYILAIMGRNWNKDFYFSLNKLQKRSTFNWDLHCVSNVDKCHSHPLWITFYELWKELLFEHVKRDECDEAMYIHFYLYHKMGNSFQTQKEWAIFNAEISQKMVKYYKEWASRNQITQLKNSTYKTEDSKITIGFLQDRLVENSPYKVQYSLWKRLMSSKEFRDKYEIVVYLMSYFEKSHNDEHCIKAVESLGIKVWDGAIPFYWDGVYHSHLEKALHIRDKIIEDGVDILISPNNGYDISDFLIAVRSAPKQIFWSHGNFQYDIDGVDERISHCLVENSGRKFKNFSVPVDSNKFHNPSIDQGILYAERSKYPENVFILGTIGRLVKVDSDEYLQTIYEIMRQNPNTIYIAAGTGNVDNVRQKVKKLGISERFYMPGWVDPHVYGHIIDLWLDTFPLRQGESLQEYMAKEKFFISLFDENYLKLCLSNQVMSLASATEAELPELKQEFELLKKMFKEVHLTYVATTKEEYIDRANLVIGDYEFFRPATKFFTTNMRLRNKQQLNEFLSVITELT